jgi:hypothetical protein
VAAGIPAPEQIPACTIRWTWGTAISPRGDMPKNRVPLPARRFCMSAIFMKSNVNKRNPQTDFLVAQVATHAAAQQGRSPELSQRLPQNGRM